MKKIKEKIKNGSIDWRHVFVFSLLVGGLMSTNKFCDWDKDPIDWLIEDLKLQVSYGLLIFSVLLVPFKLVK